MKSLKAMKAITVKNPWAWAIVYAGKDIENRTWPTKYRGPVLIHAGRSYARDAYELWPHRVVMMPPKGDLRDYGSIIGVADLVDCVTASKSKWFLGPYGFVLRNVRPIKPIPAAGKLGLWNCEINPRVLGREACHCGHAVDAHNDKLGCPAQADGTGRIDGRVCPCYCTAEEAAQKRINCL